MATKRRPLHQNNQPKMNFRPSGAEPNRNETKGTRPTAKPTSVPEVILKMILYGCKKSIFFDTNIKVALYLGSLFLISLIGDFMPYPKTYFARSDNLFNAYFVKLGWAWTLLFSTPFLCMTSYTLCCGDHIKFIKNHLPRICIATFFWFAWTKSFNIIESTFGRCSVRGFDSKSSCLKSGYLWHGFDISGHAFILIYSSLVLIEEARPIMNWDNIREHLRNEMHSRMTSETVARSNPLKHLSDTEVENLRYLYEKYTLRIRLLFIGMTVMQLLWEVMLVGTMLYFHRMIEKVLSGIIAILTWYFTYRFWYPSSVLPDAAGKGLFQYQKDIRVDPIPLRRTNSLINNSGNRNTTQQQNIPKFMGMPIFTRPPQESTNTVD